MIALLLVLGASGIAPAPAAAQLGSLIVTITAPAPGSTVTGTVTVSASVTIIGALTVQSVQFKLDGVNLGAADTTAPYAIAWDTRTATNATHTLTAVARDLLGVQYTSEPVTVTVFNDLTPPTVAITAPAAGAFVKDPLTISASASDNVGVVGVRFLVDGVQVGAEDTVAPYAVSWDPAGAADGQHTLTAVARDAAGNTATSAAVTVTVDKTAPTAAISAPAAGAFVRGTVTVQATAADNIGVAGVRFFVDGVQIGAEDTAGPYAVAWNTAGVTEGPHTLTAIARDAAGNTTTSTAVSVTVDKTAPTAAITAPAAGTFLKGTVTVTATAADNNGVAGVRFFADGVQIGAEDTVAPYAVSWSTTGVADGVHSLTAVARDVAGNTITSAAVSVTVDKTAPTAAITAPTGGALVNGTVTVTASASDNAGVVGVRFLVDGTQIGAEATAAPYSVAWNTSGVADGVHSLTAVARDAAGNTTTSAAVSVTVDKTGPTAAITAPTPGALVKGTVTITASASDNVGVAGVRFLVDGTQIGAEATTAPYSVAWDTSVVADGVHSLTAVARDTVGNTTTSAAVSVTIDTTAPTAAITAPTAGALVKGTVTVTASASDNVGVAGVRFLVDGTQIGAEATTAPYSVAWDTSAAADGAHALTAVARDTAGNTTTSAAVSVTIDKTAPTAAITAPTPGALVKGTVTITASASDNVGVAGVRFLVDGTQIGAEATTAPYSVAWDTSAAADGVHSLTAVARDTAGNTTTSAAVSVTVDKTGPTAAITAPAGGALVKGTVTITASASDNVGVAGVRFLVDGTQIGAEATAAPYSVAWDTSAVAGGTHTLTAVARDTAGNTTTSAAVSVTVDKTGPTAVITSPAAGAFVKGMVTVTATAADNAGVVGVRFLADGTQIGAEVTAAPYSVTWDTSSVADGPHTLTAVSRDAAGNTATSPAVSVTVDKTAPTAAITAPAGGAFVNGTVTVTASASDNIGVVGVRFLADGAPIGAEATTAPYSVGWDTSAVADGTHTLTAVSRDAAGNTTTSAAVSVTVDKTGPTATITAPASGAVVNGTVTVSASSGDANVVGIQFFVDGAAIGAEDTTAPYSVTWDTAGVTEGSHTLTAVARDAAGNTTTSAGVTVTVNRTPPTVTITAPANGATVSSTVTVTATASASLGVAGVQFKLDDANLGAEVTAAPYSIPWDTTTATDGSHTLTAVVRDTGGATATSAPVTVTTAQTQVTTATRFQDTDLAIVYTDGTTAPGQPAGWWHGSRSRNWSGRTASFNRSAGAKAIFTFTGTSARWIGFRAPWAGIARVYVDGTFVQELDLYWPTELVQTVVYSATGLAPGTHTLTVESTGRKNDSSVDWAVVVDAFDVTPGSTPSPQGTRFEETALSYTGAWTQGDTSRSSWSGGSAAVSATAGAQATFSFVGTEARWVGLRGPKQGIAQVFIDGAFQATVDTYSESEVQDAVFTVTNLAAAAHTLTIKVTGDRNRAATDTWIAVDALDVRARFEEVNPAVTYTPDWIHDNTAKAWSGSSTNFGTGTAVLSRTAGARATFAFTGTGVSWIGLRAPSTGIARVSVDGVPVGDVDTYAPAEQLRAVLFSTTGLADGPHTLTVEVAGQRNPSSIDSLVFIDAFDITPSANVPSITRVQDADPAIAYSGTWNQGSVFDLWSGERAAFSQTTGSRATVTFTGTAVRWIGQRAFNGGIAHVFLDGVQLADVDTFAPTQEEYQAAMLSLSGLAAGQHTLTIEVSGQSTPGSQGVMVVVDAFDID